MEKVGALQMCVCVCVRGGIELTASDWGWGTTGNGEKPKGTLVVYFL